MKAGNLAAIAIFVYFRDETDKNETPPGTQTSVMQQLKNLSGQFDAS